MECNFNKNRSKNEVKLDNQEIPQSDHFYYLRSIINKEGENVAHRIKKVEKCFSSTVW